MRQSRRLAHLGRLRGGDADAVDAAHLAGADTDRRPAAGEDDRVRFDVLGDHVGEEQIGNFALARRSAGDGAQSLSPDGDPIALLDKDAAGHRAKATARGRRIGHRAGDEQAQRRPAGEHRSRGFIGLGGDDDFDEEPGDRLGSGRVERPVERDDAAERR